MKKALIRESYSTAISHAAFSILRTNSSAVWMSTSVPAVRDGFVEPGFDAESYAIDAKCVGEEGGQRSHD